MRLSSIVSSFIVLAAAFTTGCDFELGEDSGGELGKLRFEYSSSDCIGGCSLDRPALQGSMVTVIASGPQSDTPRRARLTDAKFGDVTTREPSCSTSSGDTDCSLSVDIETKAAGDVTLEMLDNDGNVIDKIGLHIKPAARIDIVVQAKSRKPGTEEEITRDVTKGSDDVFEIKRNEKVELSSTVFADDGERMIFTQHGVTHVYADKTVLTPNTKVLFGSTSTEYMATGRAGDTSVTVKAATGAEAQAKFRVVP